MAVEPWEDLLRELRGDRGFLLGSEEYREMDPLDRMKALKSIDERIREINEWLRHYEGEEAWTMRERLSSAFERFSSRTKW